MKTFQTIAFVFAAIIACASAFSTPSPKTTLKPAAVVPTVEAKAANANNPNAAAVAAFATAMAPFAAHATDATDVDEATDTELDLLHVLFPLLLDSALDTELLSSFK